MMAMTNYPHQPGSPQFDGSAAYEAYLDSKELEEWRACEVCCGEGSVEIPDPQRGDPYYCRVVQCQSCHGAGGEIVPSVGNSQ
jgi:hypothetical protein